MKSALIILLTLFPNFSSATTALEGSASVNSCSGAFFRLDGMGEDKPGLVITNGHCIRLRALGHGQTDFPVAGEIIFNLENPLVSSNTSVTLHSEESSELVSAKELIFATMTGTDLAIFKLSLSYREIRQQFGIRPLRLANQAFQVGNSLRVHAGFFNRTQRCEVDGFTDLREGPYSTRAAVRLSNDCDFYPGFSGAPLLKERERVFLGLANTHFDDGSSGQACDLNKPCELDSQGAVSADQLNGRSYGVSTHFLYSCYDETTGVLDFSLPSCTYKNAIVGRGLASIGGESVPSGSYLDHTVVAIGNARSQFCSGTFVAKNVVLTAAHCVLADGADAIGKVGDFVYPLSQSEGFNPLTGVKIKVVKVSIHPDKHDQDISILGFPFDNPDFALLKLEHSYDEAQPAKLGSKAVPEEHLHVAGFGRGNENWQRPSKLDFRIVGDARSFIDETYGQMGNEEIFEFMRAFRAEIDRITPYFYLGRTALMGQQTVCYGDSGAPLYRLRDGRVELAGVASLFLPHPTKGNQACGMAFLNLFAKIEPYRSWLLDEIEALSRDFPRK